MSESLLIDKYRKLLGIDNIVTTGDDVFISGEVTVTSNLFVSDNGIVGNDIFVSSITIISGNSMINGNISITDNLSVANNTIVKNNITNLNDLLVNNNMTIANTLYAADTKITGDVTILNNLYVKENIIINDKLSVNNIYSNGDSINIISNIINIGNENTIINLNGSTINILSKELSITDKLISLNYDNNTKMGIDKGNDSGLIFYNSINNGYIKTNSTADRFLILPPGSFTEKYIATIDMSNNLVISGNSNFNGNVTINNILNVKGNAYFNNNLAINNNLNLLENLIVGNNITSTGTLYISNLTNLTNNITVANNIYVSNNTNIANDVTLYSKLNVSGLSIINGNMTVLSNINVMNNILCNNNITILSSLICNNNVINNNNLTVGNNVNVIADSIMNNISIGNTLYVSNNTIIQNNITINSNLYISGNSSINGSAIFGNKNSITTIMGNLYTTLLEYDDNEAAINAGLPLWTLYRTGGIIKVVVYETPPTVTFTGYNLTTVNVLSVGKELIFSNILNISSHPNYPVSGITFPSYIYYQYPGGETTTATKLDSTLSGNHTITFNIYDYFNNLKIQKLLINISNGYYNFIIEFGENYPITSRTDGTLVYYNGSPSKNYLTHNNLYMSNGVEYRITYMDGINNSTIIPTYELNNALGKNRMRLPSIYNVPIENNQTAVIIDITRNTDYHDNVPSSMILSKQFLDNVGYDHTKPFCFLYKGKANVSGVRFLYDGSIICNPTTLLYLSNITYQNTDNIQYGPTDWNNCFSGGHMNYTSWNTTPELLRFGIIRYKNIRIFHYGPIIATNNINYSKYYPNGYPYVTIKTYRNNDTSPSETFNSVPSTANDYEVTLIRDLNIDCLDFSQGFFYKQLFDGTKHYMIFYDNRYIKRIEIIYNNAEKITNLKDSIYGYSNYVEYVVPHLHYRQQSTYKFYEGIVFSKTDITPADGLFPKNNDFTYNTSTTG